MKTHPKYWKPGDIVIFQRPQNSELGRIFAREASEEYPADGTKALLIRKEIVERRYEFLPTHQVVRWHAIRLDTNQPLSIVSIRNFWWKRFSTLEDT